jgi:hypothetical protein
VFIVRGEISGFIKDKLLQQHLQRMVSLVKSAGIGCCMSCSPALSQRRLPGTIQLQLSDVMLVSLFLISKSAAPSSFNSSSPSTASIEGGYLSCTALLVHLCRWLL